MIIAVTGASGFVGRRLCQMARAGGHEVVRLSRGEQGDRRWDPMREPAPLEDVDAVVHLAGEPLTRGRWTAAKMRRIRDSRVLGTRNLVAGLRRSRAGALVTASAVGFYGDRGEEELNEDSGPGGDFLAGVCLQWEAEAAGSGVRTVLLRSGTVLGPGGALEKMIPPFGMGLGGKLGSGRQWMSWIHRDDLASLYLFALEKEDLTGPLVAAAPGTVRSEDFTRALARVLEKPAVLRIPRWGLRLAVGRVASVLLASQNCRPDRALSAGFRFAYPDLGAALAQAVDAWQAEQGRAA